MPVRTRRHEGCGEEKGLSGGMEEAGLQSTEGMKGRLVKEQGLRKRK